MNIEIVPPEGKIKFLGQLITFKNAVQVELEHRIQCAWATFRSHWQEFDVTKVPAGIQIQTLRRHSDPVTSPRFRKVDDDGRDEVETPDNTTTDDEDDHTDTEKKVKVTQLRTPRASTILPTSSPTTPTASWRTTRLSTISKTSTSKRQSRRRARTVGRLHSESNAQCGRLVSGKRNHVVDPQAEPDFLEAERWEDDLNIYLQPDRSNRQQRSRERHDLAHYGGRRLEMGHYGK